MAFDAHVLKVLIASPGDTVEERDAVQRALHAWNGDRAERESVVLLPRRWETDAIPRLGSSAQSVINEQFADASDVVIALFDSRLGMATPESVSGTAEEIKRAHGAGKPVHVWFSDEPLPRDVDLEQYKALQVFKNDLAILGLLGSYSSPDDLAFKVRQAIELDVIQLDLGPASRPKPPADHAVLRARYEFDREQHMDNKGRLQMRTRHERLVVRNQGAARAEDVQVSLRVPEGLEGAAPQLHSEGNPTIIPDAEFSWPLIMYMGVASIVEVVMSWKESGESMSEIQQIST